MVAMQSYGNVNYETIGQDVVKAINSLVSKTVAQTDAVQAVADAVLAQNSGVTVVPGRVITAGPYTVVDGDYLLVVRQTISAAITVSLPATPLTWRTVIVKDGKGDASVYNITVSGNGSTIDGAASHTISTGFGSAMFTFDGTMWGRV